MKVLALFFALMAATAFGQDPDATAKFLAGLPVRGTSAEKYSLDPAWATHAAEFDSAWTKLEQRQLSRIRDWAPQYLGGAYKDDGPMFYMFSGPDILYAQAFFPNASTYILAGTEPVGVVPDLGKVPAMGSSLANLRKSLSSLLSWSFFITKDMRVDLNQNQLSGTLPVLYVFLARAGCQINDVSLVSLNNDGQLTSGKGATPGVKITFRGPTGKTQTLYYFTTDLADWGIKSKPGFLKFCDSQGSGVTLLKAASYLMHENGFGRVRDFLLGHSKLILQDDSGIPHRYFLTGKWAVRYCGNYKGPIELFKQHYQADLAKIYAGANPLPLQFGFGYQWHTNAASLTISTPK